MISIMRVMIGKDEIEWVKHSWTWIHDEIQKGQRVFIPAGGTPKPLYRRWTAEPTALLKSLRLMQLDEIMTGSHKGEFRRFFQSELEVFLPQMEWISNCDGLADAAILGVGVNGHVAFHEPGLPRNFWGGCVPLSPETRRYLNLTEPTWGLTYGVEAFMRAKKILVMVKGENKHAIMSQAVNRKDLPISWILTHPNVTVVSDFEIGA